MIVTKDDLKTLTGYMRASAQIRWLHRHGWTFIVNGLGDPIVALDEFNRHMVGGRKSATVSQEPNLEGINDLGVEKSVRGRRDKVTVPSKR